MDILLLLILFIMMCTSIAVFGLDFLSVSVLTTALFFIASVISVAYERVWGFSFYPNTVFTIALYLFTVNIGELLIREITSKSRMAHTNPKVSMCRRLAISKSVIFLFIIIQSYLVYFQMQSIASLAALYPGFAGAQTSLGAVRNLQNLGVASTGNMVTSFASIISSCFSYVAVYVFVHNADIKRENLQKKSKYELSYLAPLIFTMALHVLSGAKINIFIDISYIGFLLLIQYSISHQFKRMSFLRVCKNVFIFAVIFIGIMYSMTLLRNGESNDMVNTIACYAGSSVPALNSFLQEKHTATYFGENTFAGIRYLLNKVGFDVACKTVFYDEFTSLPGLSTNIYTSIRSFYIDFGMFGVGLFGLITGAIFGAFRKVLIRKINNPLFIIFYAYYSWLIIRQIIADSLFSELFSIMQILMFVFIMLTFKLVVRYKGKSFDSLLIINNRDRSSHVKD